MGNFHAVQHQRRFYCADQHIFCPVWAMGGHCLTNAGYMLTKCLKSCQQCTTGQRHVTLMKEIAEIKLLLNTKLMIGQRHVQKQNQTDNIGQDG